MALAQTIDWNNFSDAEILAKLKEYKLALTKSEVLKIQNEILHRPPTLAECILWSIQGSEHSSYKSSKKYLKQFSVDAPNVMLGIGEDAGIVEVARDQAGHRYGIAISHESHNHPSQVVPYEGAATGVGGNVRDIACMGAKVIGGLDSLRFGGIVEPRSQYLAGEVVAGIAGYGNPIGVPILGGDIYFDKGYSENCLVNVIHIGTVRDNEIIHSRAPANAVGYKLILVGKPTDNSGFGGASFASLELNEAEKETNKGAVQEPNAFLKRHILKATYALFDILKTKNLLNEVGFKDLGAGGIACASVELADHGGYGATVDIDLVPKGMDNLNPAVYLCSETQERFMWVAPADIAELIINHYNNTFELTRQSKGAAAAIVGEIRGDGRYVVVANGETIVDALAKDVTSGLSYDRPTQKIDKNLSEPNLPEPNDYNEILLKVLAHENVASRAPIYEKYDKQVQGLTVLEAGEADAGVIQPFKDKKFPAEIRDIGVAIKADNNPRYGKIDAYWGGANAVCEAMRNVAAVGAAPVGLTDCLNFGNPEKPEQMYEFSESTRGVAEAAKQIHLKNFPDSPVPILAGNVSLYNESNGKGIPASPNIACLGKMDEVSKAISFSFKKSDSVILMIGARRDECGGSVYYDILGQLGANVPKPDFKEAEAQIFALTDAIDAGLILTSHDISDGGIATTLCEMSFKNNIGFEVKIPGDLSRAKKLFSETGGFVVEVAGENVEAVRNIFGEYGVSVFEIGRTIEDLRLKIKDCVDLDLIPAKKAWTNGLREKL